MKIKLLSLVALCVGAGIFGVLIWLNTNFTISLLCFIPCALGGGMLVGDLLNTDYEEKEEDE